MDCIFCKIASGEIPIEPVYQDEQIIAFRDIRPQAPVHLQVIPKKHIPTLLDIKMEDAELFGHLMTKIPKIAEIAGLQEGFRLVGNCKSPAGQEVYHIHFHLLGQRKFSWPPG